MQKKLLLNRETLQTKLLEATPEDFRLLEHAYKKIYRPAFTQPDHRERLGDLKEYLETKSATPSAQEYNILVATHQAQRYEIPVGIATANRLTDSGITIAFFEYAAVHPAYRGQGLWSTLTKERVKVVDQQADKLNTKLVAIFTETEKPSLTSAEQSLSEERKSELLQRRAIRRNLLRKLRFSEDAEDKYSQLDFDYVQLPLRDIARSVHNLDLLVRFDPEYRQNFLPLGVPRELMLQCLKMYLASFQVAYDYRQHLDFKKMRKEIEKQSVRLKEL